MEIFCQCCDREITPVALGRSELPCPHCGTLVNGFGQPLATTHPDPAYAGEEYWEEDF